MITIVWYKYMKNLCFHCAVIQGLNLFNETVKVEILAMILFWHY